MLTTLNIGLAVEGHRDNEPDHVVGSVRTAFPGMLRGYRVAMSDTERTLVLRLELDRESSEHTYDFAGRIYKLACLWGQDCIAVKFAGIPSGDLIGPNAKAWGKYNPAFFIDYE